MRNLNSEEKEILKKALYLKPFITKDGYAKLSKPDDKLPLCRANDERVQKRDMDRRVFYLKPFDISKPMFVGKGWTKTITNCKIFVEPICYTNVSFIEDIAAEGRVEFKKLDKETFEETYGTFEEVLKQIPQNIRHVYEKFDKYGLYKRNKEGKLDDNYRLIEFVDYTPFKIHNIDGFTGKRFMTARIFDIDQSALPEEVKNQDVIYKGERYTADEIREMAIKKDEL